MNERCFAMNRSSKCGILLVKGCPGYRACHFYKPTWKHHKDVSMANTKLCSLPEEMQLYIAEKYYNGGMPWKEEHQ